MPTLNEADLLDKNKMLVKVSKELYRLFEAENFIANNSEAKKNLASESKIKFKKLFKKMLNYDLDSDGKGPESGEY